MYLSNLSDVERRLDWLENHGVAASVSRHSHNNWLVLQRGYTPRRKSGAWAPLLAVLVIVGAIALASI